MCFEGWRRGVAGNGFPARVYLRRCAVVFSWVLVATADRHAPPRESCARRRRRRNTGTNDENAVVTRDVPNTTYARCCGAVRRRRLRATTTAAATRSFPHHRRRAMVTVAAAAVGSVRFGYRFRFLRFSLCRPQCAHSPTPPPPLQPRGDRLQRARAHRHGTGAREVTKRAGGWPAARTCAWHILNYRLRARARTPIKTAARTIRGRRRVLPSAAHKSENGRSVVFLKHFCSVRRDDL